MVKDIRRVKLAQNNKVTIVFRLILSLNFAKIEPMNALLSFGVIFLSQKTGHFYSSGSKELKER